MVASTQSAVEVADKIIEACTRDWEDYKYLKTFRNEVLELATEHAVRSAHKLYLIWKAEGRQALAIHPELVTACAEATSERIDMQICRALPYINPLVVFPEPLTYTWETGESLKMFGYFVYGLTNSAAQGDKTGPYNATLTHDASARYLGAMLIMSNYDQHGRYIDMEFDKISMSLDRVTSLEELTRESMMRFKWDERAQDYKLSDLQNFMRFAISSVLGSIFYLCSTTLDAETPPRKSVQRFRHKPIRVKYELTKIGWKLGNAVTTARKAAKDQEQAGPGRMQGPQQRRGHFKTVWIGKGRRTPKTAFVAPYITHREVWDRIDEKTLRHVPKPKEDTRI